MNLEELNEIGERGDRHEIVRALGEFTSRQIAQLDRDEKLTFDWVYPVWAFSDSWGFELKWASMLLMSEEEIEEMKAESEYEDGTVPENFDPNIKLKDLVAWTPMDQICGVSL